jgi:molecular chaperone Hsp33
MNASTPNFALPFTLDALDTRGRVVKLSSEIDVLLKKHNYPAPVSRIVAEACVLAALIGAGLKYQGRLIVQIQTKGPISLVVVDMTLPNGLRALAQYDENKLKKAVKSGYLSTSALLGRGTLALTIDQGTYMQRYQGVVAIEGQGLERAALQYYMQSEQIPSRFRLAASEMNGAWQASGLMLQYMPQVSTHQDFDGGDGSLVKEENEKWGEVKALLTTLEDAELLEASAQTLIYRLFNQHEILVFEETPLCAKCTCSHERLLSIVRGFTREEKQASTENGKITMTCDYCSSSYEFKAEEVL